MASCPEKAASPLPIGRLDIPNAEPVVFACGTCGQMYGFQDKEMAKNTAIECCAPRTCDACKMEFPREPQHKYRIVCEKCWDKARWQKDMEKLNKAKQVPEKEYTGWVYWGDDYYQDTDELRDHSVNNEIPLPVRVWGCKPVAFALDVQDMIERAVEGQHDEFELDSKAVAELQAVVDAWAAKQDQSSVEVDESVVVVLDQSEGVFETDEEGK